MFLLNVGYAWTTAAEMESVRGVIILPSANQSIRVKKGNFEKQRVMFDPQLYLADLCASECKTACSRLATYPWFMVPDIPAYSDELSQRKWQGMIEDVVVEKWPAKSPGEDRMLSACKSCIDYQVDIGCTHIILPAPLIVSREDEGAEAMAWLDAGIDVAKDLELTEPILATVAIDEIAINETVFESSGLLDGLVDQCSAREGLDGVYIVVMQSRGKHPFDGEPSVNKAYLHLSDAFSRAGLDIVIVNFADVFGLVCMSLGATGVATGDSHSRRRMSRDNFVLGSGGHALPHLYSHRNIAEYLSYTDLSKITEKKMLRRVADETPYSEELINALKSGRTAENVASWVESKNNHAAARKHYVFRMAEVVEALATVVSREVKREQVRGWLEDAAANMLYIGTKVGGGWRPRHVAPADQWVELFDACVGK